MILIYMLLMLWGISGLMRIFFYRPRFFYQRGPRDHMMHDEMMHNHGGRMWEDGKWM